MNGPIDANTLQGKGNAPIQEPNVETLRAQFESGKQLLFTWLKIGSLVATGLSSWAVYELVDIRNRIAVLETNVIDLYKEQRDALAQRDAQLLHLYESRTDGSSRSTKR